ncbi:MAG: hypothetical protein Q8O95_03200 [bacterium]|nr:hypothetical protein [bacterium]
MRKILSSLLSILFLWTTFTSVYVISTAFSKTPVAFASFHNVAPDVHIVGGKWELEKGDWLLIDLEKNELRFVSEGGHEMSTPVEVGSGINTGKPMRYLGRVYDPATPEQVWEIRSKMQQNWYGVFGSKESQEQLFLRLYEIKDNGEAQYTPYGIHTTPEIDELLVKDDGYNSWGCILTSYHLLKILEELYELNDHVVKVVTTRESDLEEVVVLNAPGA